MGQQQLLLIVLGVIIVGVAIVAGIGMFSANAEESVKDELVNQCVVIGAHAQEMYKKPVAMGGLGLAFDNYVLPVRMSATLNCGTIGADGIPTAAGYVAKGAGQTVTVTATPNAVLKYGWTVTATVTPDNITTVVK